MAKLIRSFRNGIWGFFDPESARFFPQIAGGAGEEGEEEEGKPKGKAGEEEEGKAGEEEEETGGEEEEAAAKGKSAEELREELRKSDRTRKRESRKKDKELAELRKQLKEREDADKSEQEKALEQAKEEVRKEVMTEARKERRSDRLEVAATRLASKGVEIEVEDGEGETKTQTVRFDDPEDAQIYLDRAIARGDVDDDELFDDDDKVNSTLVTEALTEILRSKPRLRAGAAGSEDQEEQRPKGKSPAGKGSGKGKDLGSMSVEDHLSDIQRKK